MNAAGLRAARRQGWIVGGAAIAVLFAAAQLGGAWVEHGLVALAFFGTLVAALDRSGRPPAGPLALAALGAAAVSLAVRFLADDFTYHQVWLLSAPELARWLKLASLWSGDEGTLLLLGLIGLGLAIRLDRRDGWAGPGAYLLAAVFVAGTLVWDPFRATPATALAAHPYRGMNAHLTSVWMLVHPPLVFFSYMLLVAPWGAMAEALIHRRGPWREVAAVYARGGWLLLSAGIGFGMWWAYQDFTYGTLWHWDPVQTAIFVSWAFLTAMLHAQRLYRPDGAFGIAHPLLGLLAAAGAVLAMAVTRSPTLASSHRYVGETSLPLLASVAAVLLIVLIVALIARLMTRPSRLKRPRERRALLWLAIGLFSAFGAVAFIHIGLAFGSAWAGLPRSDDLKPFFETLRNFGSVEELARLRAAFAQWDIDNFGANRWLAPLGCLAGLIGGHYFLPLAGWRRWAVSGAVVALGLATSLWLRPFAAFFEGTGLTSGKTVAIFPWLDFLVVALAYLLVAALAWAALAVARRPNRTSWGYNLPVGVIHGGAVIGLVGILAATVFDSYSQRFVAAPAGLSKPLAFPGGYRLRIGGISGQRARDGVRAAGRDGGFRSVARVTWWLERDGEVLTRARGHAVYRDDRPPYSTEVGSVRLMCEIIDYRYARYMSGSKQMIHPLISRGLLRDVQIWIPAVSGSESAPPNAGQVPVILKVFPLMSFVWIGLLLVLVGFLIHMVVDRPRPPNRRVTRPPV
jgi:cytochrome c-type biogenesis protein CcmF